MSVFINAHQRLGIGVSVSIALTEIAERHGIRLEPKQLGDLSETIVSEMLDRGEKP
jgi:hypothetical protein